LIERSNEVRVGRGAWVGSVVLAVAVALLTPPVPAGAAVPAAPAQPHVVSATPASYTPDVHDGHVEEITQVGSRIVLGGNFTSVSPAGSATTLTRNRILAFDATTGRIDAGFAPNLDDQVNALLPGPNADTVYVGGLFKSLNGVPVRQILLLSTVTGLPVAGFAPPPLNGYVGDVKRRGNRLYVGGAFTKVGGVAHAGLVTLDAATGALDPFVDLQIAGHHSDNPTGAQAPVAVNKLDLSPDGTRMVAIGNFKTVNAGDYDQVVMVDLTGLAATIANWQTNSFDPECNTKSHDSYVRDVDFSPDGSYFAIATTGGPDGRRSLCDSASRWETGATGTNLKPTWVDWTGGDSLLSVTVTGAAVYVGGHQRWLNNAFGGGVAGPGAVPRPGIAALDPVNGLPLSWNPGRNPRGAGTYALFASADGLYVGSDTSYIGAGADKTEHARIVFFPLAGGDAAAGTAVGRLPGSVEQLGLPPSRRQAANVLYRVNAGGPALQSLDTGPNWSPDAAFHNAGNKAISYAGGVSLSTVVPSTTPRAIFDTERSDPGVRGDGGEMQWTFAVPSAAYLTVRLYFANRCRCSAAPGQRSFDMLIDGSTVLANYDITADAGDQTGTMKTFSVAPQSDGTLTVGFAHVAGDPVVDGIEILNADLASAPAETVPGGDAVTARSFDGTTSGPLQPVSSASAWHHSRGAFMVGNSLFYGWDDSTLRTRAFDGTTFGPESSLDPYHDPVWQDVQTGSGQTYVAIVPDFYGELDNVTAMFYVGGRLYYTLLGSSGLFNRYFSPESGIVGTEEFAGDAGGIDWSNTAGAFLDAANQQLYFSRLKTGQLMRVGWSDAPAIPVAGQAATGGAPTGTAVAVSSLRDWRGRGIFIRP